VIDPHFVLLGAAFSLLGAAGYCREILRGRVRPNRVSWLLWAVAPLIAFAAQVSGGVGLPSVLALSVGLGPLCVFACSFAGGAGRWRLGRLDLLCGALSVLAIVLWLASGSGTVAIVMSIAADALAAVPTLVKAIRAPETEYAGAFRNGVANATITLLTIHHWSFASAGFPVYILLLTGTLYAVIRFRSHNDRRCARSSSSAPVSR
jgi:hypothetical protein